MTSQGTASGRFTRDQAWPSVGRGTTISDLGRLGLRLALRLDGARGGKRRAEFVGAKLMDSNP
jgi:hypothetical protein